MSYLYRVYGLNVKSEILIPELSKLDDSENNIDVEIKYGIVSEEIKEQISKGYNGSYQNQDMWFNISDLAIYHIINGNQVIIEPYKNADNKLIKVYILGSVLGMVLLQNNIVAIHGGGIVIDNKGCVFTGDKGAGKSTLTTALRQRGYNFVADDVCSINHSDVNKIYPGFGYQKLCEDTMEKLGYNCDEYEPFRSDFNIKYIVPAIDDFVDEEVPFEAVFELSVGDVDEVQIKEITGIDKMQSLIKNIFRIEMLYYSGGIPPKYFKKCADIAKNIKYYKITRPKDIFSVDNQIQVIEKIIFESNLKGIQLEL